MDFDGLIGPIDLREINRWEAIEELINHLVANRKIKPEHQDAIAASVRLRESAMTTGIGFGIGIPHAATDLITEIIGIVGRSRQGIQFNAVDGKPVHLVLLYLVPQGEFQKHAQTLANMAKMLHHQDFRDGLWGRFS